MIYVFANGIKQTNLKKMEIRCLDENGSILENRSFENTNTDVKMNLPINARFVEVYGSLGTNRKRTLSKRFPFKAIDSNKFDLVLLCRPINQRLQHGMVSASGILILLVGFNVSKEIIFNYLSAVIVISGLISSFMYYFGHWIELVELSAKKVIN